MKCDNLCRRDAKINIAISIRKPGSEAFEFDAMCCILCVLNIQLLQELRNKHDLR